VLKIKEKLGKIEYKARLTAKGFAQTAGVDFKDTFAPVVKMISIRLLLALSVTEKFILRQLDVNTAFPNALLPESEQIYMKIPPELKYAFPELVWSEDAYLRLLRALYGLKQASREWYETLSKFLKDNGYEPTVADSCVFIKGVGDNRVIVIIYVDDIIVGAKQQCDLDALRVLLHAQYKLKDEELKVFLGIEITQNTLRNHIRLNQDTHIANVVSKFKCFINDRPSPHVPMNPLQKLSRLQQPQTQEARDAMALIPYRSAIGSLNFPAMITRMDISFAVNKCARYMSNPGQAHWDAVLDILAYLRGVPSASIEYSGDFSKTNFLPNVIYAFVDSDHAGDPDTRRSTSGYTIMLNGGPIAWQVKAQDEASGGGTTESEYKGLYLVVITIVWLRQLMASMGYPQSAATLIFCDAQSAINFSHNPIYQSRLKHIDVKYHAVREYLESKAIELRWIQTASNIADIFTKALDKNTFWSFVTRLLSIPQQYIKFNLKRKL
jgi:hypothetical protein